eukprot:CAMPEP_0204289236 /NCGR_PEP_ID=MMETSP0468-20130131/58270_1 /ASSEMBLY_ACC=CAM_ASM_000383 /TAXON_ID=2969 /ORGANISM="Oxyrrhis marina" /LENGTH=64 /DNA_ID=CAMNT_0051267379 /DNA_START=142 /DNA_END=333 /DNA_ORIENTATION=+
MSPSAPGLILGLEEAAGELRAVGARVDGVAGGGKLANLIALLGPIFAFPSPDIIAAVPTGSANW